MKEIDTDRLARIAKNGWVAGVEVLDLLAELRRVKAELAELKATAK